MAWHATWNNQPEKPQPPRGFFVDRGGMFPPGVKLILFSTVGVFLLQAFGYDAILSAYGSLSVRDLLHLEVWRLVTYMFLHASMDHILINMLVLVMLGSYLERQIGVRAFLAMYFACGIAGGVCESLFNWIMFLMHASDVGPHFLVMPAVGASAGVMGVLVGFATRNPREQLLLMFVLPVEAWMVAAGYGIFETWPLLAALVTGHVPRGDNVAHAAHFGGMVAAFLWIKWGFHIADFMRGLMVTDRPAFVNRDPQEESQEENRILDKIHAKGIDSLTTSEKMFLQEMSRKRRRP